MESKPLVPKLRFPEFQDAGPWDALNGDCLFETIDRRPATPGLPVLAITQEQGAVPRDEIDYHVSVTDASVAGYKEVRPGDFIISLRSFQGGIEHSKVNGICSPAYIILNRKGEGSDDFYRHLFKSPRFIQQITRNIEGIRDGKMISFKQFSEQLLPAPSPGEQQKIAECLTSLDELIAAEGRKLEALRAHKKGLLQSLFPREGETTPRLRFPEFRSAGDWQTTKLDDLYRFGPTNTFSREMLNYDRGCIKNIHYGDIHKKFSASFDALQEEVPFVNSELLPDEPVATSLCEEGDIVLADASEDLDDVGKAVEIVALHGQRIVAGTHTILAKRIKDQPTLGFGAFLFQSSQVRTGIRKEAQGTKVFGISPTRLAGIEIAMPKETREQQRITDCLFSLDAQITAQANKLDTLKLHKQGLMQGLFPSLGAQ
jgi:type I restriction enzyme, S subunit